MSRPLFLRLTGLGTLCLAVALASQAAPAKSLQALRVHEPVSLDGRLDEAVWKSALAASAFTQDAPSFGTPAGAATDVRIAYDDQSLYIGARMQRAPNAAVTALVHRRDQDSHSDWFSVAIDSMHDRRTALMFSVNAAGVQRDVLLHSDTSSDDSWDAVWQSAVSVDESGWTAELKVPLSLFRIATGAQTWAVNFTRRDQTPYELSRWHVVARGESAFVSRFPELAGLEGLQPRRRREFIPYVSSIQKVRTAETFDDLGNTTKIGLDAHLGLGSKTQLDITANPDYGQAEVDETVLNLSTIETFFPEKRPFFLEGMDIFRVGGVDLFYSRRIGAGLGYPQMQEGETLLGRPLASDILGAAKLTSKLDNGVNLGVLAAVTNEAQALIGTENGQTLTRTVGHGTIYGVGRGLKQIGTSGSFIGGFASIVDERGENGRRAMVGAVDGMFKSQDRTLQVDFLGAFSNTGWKSDELASGSFGRLAATKRFSNNGYLAGSLTNVDRGFDLRDAGYLARSDYRELRTEGGRNWDSTWKTFRNWGFYASATYAEDQAGHAFRRNVDGRFSTELTNSWTVYVGGGMDLATEDDRELRTFFSDQKTYLQREAVPYVTAGFATSGSGPYFVSLDLQRAAEEGGPAYGVSLNQTFRPTSRIELGSSTWLGRSAGTLRWLETQRDGMAVIGYQRMSELSQIVRASYAFTPRLTLQAFTQFFVANWSYRDLNVAAPEGPTAFSSRVWNVNMIARWEFMPGSALYAIYTKGTWSGELANRAGALSPANDLPMLFRQPADDALQIKISWMFD
ncbi:MAG TPA: DUF5916 domain-containing protein [Thermoanaerobaculia bacterium]|nr:DUF5916 domain-containing protein [Thermoanaerobaculia bacterium]